MVYGSEAWAMNVECKIGADRDEDGTMDVWCVFEGQSVEREGENGD